MPTILNVTPFDEQLLPLVADFDCSEGCSAAFWEEEINEWINMDLATEDGALYWMTKGTRVWLYTNEENEVVGYGTLGESKWPDPEIVGKVKKLPRVPVNLIPAVGINRRFQGKPEGPDKAQNYSTKIMNHLVFEARKHTERQPFLGLYVHPKNEKAIKLYRRIQFHDFVQKCWNERAGVDYLSMILKLVDYPPTPKA